MKELSKKKRGRRVTKHFTNLSLWLPENELRMIMWLLYEASAAGEIQYSTHLLTKYCLAFKFINEEYYNPPIKMNVKMARGIFRNLVDHGLLSVVSKKKFQIKEWLLK